MGGRLANNGVLSSTVNDSTMPADADAELAELYAADRREHAAVPPTGTPEYQADRKSVV